MTTFLRMLNTMRRTASASMPTVPCHCHKGDHEKVEADRVASMDDKEWRTKRQKTITLTAAGNGSLEEKRRTENRENTLEQKDDNHCSARRTRMEGDGFLVFCSIP
jgi:hypothetical protein